MPFKKIFNNKFFLFFLMIFLSSCILLCENIFFGDDLNFHLSRILFINNNISNGDFFSGLYYFFGYGYGEAFFYPDFFLYFPALLFHFTNNIILSYKFFILLINILVVTTTYYSVFSITKSKKNSIIITLIYTLLPYRLCTMYYRTSLGESLAFIFFPLVLSGFFQLISGNTKKWYILAIGMSGLILSHLLSSILIFVALIPLFLIYIKKLNKDILFGFFKTIIMTISLTAFFIFPMLEQMAVSKFKFYYAGYDVALNNRALGIFNIFTEYNMFFNSNDFWMPPGIGVLLTLSIILFICNYKRVSTNTKILYIFGLFILLLTTNIFPWKYLNKYVRVLQFPWRILSISIVTLLAACTSMLSDLEIKKNKIMILIMCLFSLSSLYTCYLSLDRGRINSVRYSIAWGEYFPIEFKERSVLYKNEYNLFNIRKNHFVIDYKNRFDYNVLFNNNTYLIEFDNNKDTNNELKLPIVYYKGYVCYVNRKKTDVYKTDDGRVGINLGDSKGKIVVKYKSTVIQIVARVISAIGLFLLLICIFKRKKKI